MRKKSIVFTVAMAAMLLFSGVAQAQYRGGSESAVGVNVGASLVNLLFRAVSYADESGWKSTQIPTLQATYDYRVAERISIGGAAAFSNIKVDYDNPNLQNIKDDQLQNFNLGLTRINIAARALFYYTTGKSFELYSGLRPGINIWSISADSTDPDFTELDPLEDVKMFARAASPGLQIIGLGTNIYPTDNIGINLELTLGQPYFAAIGMKYRF